MTLKSKVINGFAAMSILASGVNAKTEVQVPNCDTWKNDIAKIISNAKNTGQKVEEGDFKCKQGNTEHVITIKNGKIIQETTSAVGEFPGK